MQTGEYPPVIGNETKYLIVEFGGNDFIYS